MFWGMESLGFVVDRENLRKTCMVSYDDLEIALHRQKPRNILKNLVQKGIGGKGFWHITSIILEIGRNSTRRSRLQRLPRPIRR